MVLIFISDLVNKLFFKFSESKNTENTTMNFIKSETLGFQKSGKHILPISIKTLK